MEVQQVSRRRGRRGETGFSFIEVVIASLLLLMIAVAVLPMFTEAASSNETGREYTDVSNFARSRAEEFMQVPFDSDPVTITAGTSRIHDEYYSKGFKRWMPGTTPVSGDTALWLRRTTIRQFLGSDTSFTTPLPAGTDPTKIEIKEIVVEVRGAHITSLFGPAKNISVRLLKFI